MVYAASALAANTIVRSAVAAAFPLFTTKMYEKLGVQWASTLIGLVSLVLAPIPFLFFKYGAKIRERSRFVPHEDLRRVVAGVAAQEMAPEKIEMTTV